MSVNTASRPPEFYIGKIPVHGDVILAPMDGISDHPFRLLCRRMARRSPIPNSSMCWMFPPG